MILDILKIEDTVEIGKSKNWSESENDTLKEYVGLHMKETHFIWKMYQVPPLLLTFKLYNQIAHRREAFVLVCIVLYKNWNNNK